MCIVSKYSAYRPMYGLKAKLYRFQCKKLEPLQNNASPSNTNNAHILRTTNYNSHAKNLFTGVCSLCSCGHFRIFSFDVFNVHSVLSCPQVEFYAFSWNQLVVIITVLIAIVVGYSTKPGPQQSLLTNQVRHNGECAARNVARRRQILYTCRQNWSACVPNGFSGRWGSR